MELGLVPFRALVRQIVATRGTGRSSFGKPETDLFRSSLFDALVHAKAGVADGKRRQPRDGAAESSGVPQAGAVAE